MLNQQFHCFLSAKQVSFGFEKEENSEQAVRCPQLGFWAVVEAPAGQTVFENKNQGAVSGGGGSKMRRFLLKLLACVSDGGGHKILKKT